MTGRSGEGRKGSRKTLRVTVVVSEGIDSLNLKDETLIDLNIYADMKLGSINQAVLKVLQLNEDDKIIFSAEHSKVTLDLEKTFWENTIMNGDKLYLELGRKKRKASQGVSSRSKRDEVDAPGSEEVLELVCTTRIFDQDTSQSSPIRRVRVIVCSDQLCKDLIQDVSTLWGRTGLKFKCGRTILQPNKTFEELGVENNAEIVVTGGRG